MRRRCTTALGSMWRRITALRSNRPASRPAPDCPPLSRRDLGWASATAAASAVLFSTIITSYPGLGDAPETVAGVGSLGVLHAPGYPAYVLAARAFTLLIPLGTLAFKVNLFSLVCASLSVGGVQLLARRCGAARWASALGGLCLAVGAGFWFYAGFAKHDTFSGLAFIVALHLLLAWRAEPTTGKLAGVGAAVAIGFGSSWPLMSLLLPTVGFVLLSQRRQLSLRPLLAATSTGLVVMVALYGFVIVRAGEDPPLNWGGATSVGRLFQLVRRSDFTAPGSSGQPSSAGSPRAGTARAPTGTRNDGAAAILPPAASITTPVRNYLVIFARELGILGIALAGWGLVVSLRRRRSIAAYPLLVTFVVNLLGASALVGLSSTYGWNGALIEEGFLLGCYFVLPCWVAVGATDAVERASFASRGLAPATRRILAPVAAGVLAAGALVPPLIAHWPVAHRTAEPFADRYASTVFAELPARAALFIWGAELTQPLIYRQVVYHERRDVVVIAADGLTYGWYREQVSHRLGRTLPPLVGDPIIDARRVVTSLRGVRPVYLDAYAGQLLSVGYRQIGLVAQLAGGSRPVPISSAPALDQTMRAAERTAGIPGSNATLWPNDYLSSEIYSNAVLEVARAYYEHHDLAGTRRALLNDLSIDPQGLIARADLAGLPASP